MTRRCISISFFCIFVLLITSVAFCASPMESKKAYSTLLKKSDKCYVMGRFTIVHKSDPRIVPPKYSQNAHELTSDCFFVTSIEFVNTDNPKKKFDIILKPLIDSSAKYYSNEKQLTENTADPLWTMELPPGNYEASAAICRLTLKMSGYHDWRDQIINTPISELTKETIKFTVQPGKVLYIGDFEANLLTCILLHQSDGLYPFRIFRLNYKKDFDKTKLEFLNNATESEQNTLNEIITSI